MNLTEVIEARNEIARAALNGDARYSHNAIGDERGDINAMETETGLPRIYKAQTTDDVAVYSDGTRHVLVMDANGPVSVEVTDAE